MDGDVGIPPGPSRGRLAGESWGFGTFPALSMDCTLVWVEITGTLIVLSVSHAETGKFAPQYIRLRALLGCWS
jgi:hypothetical protein